MRLTAQLALNQIKINRNRSLMTMFGIALSASMLTAVCGFVESAKVLLEKSLEYEYDNANYNATLIIMGVVLGAIIVTASVIVVSNAFRVSAAERTRQFGILKSVGATKKQIASTVLYEGIFLSAIGIPVGIGVGLLIELLGVSIITNLLHTLSDGGTLNVVSEEFLTVPFTAPPLMFLIAAVTAFGTVLLSAWLPARKAAKIAAIDAIRGAGEVKLKGKNVRTSGLTQAFFGFEGALAAKSLKRSRRSFRATVVSLTISITLLIVAGSFSTLMQRSTNLMFLSVDATAAVDWSSAIAEPFDDAGAATDTIYIPLDTQTAEAITEKLRSYNGAEIYGSGGIRRYRTTLPDGAATAASLISVDKTHYEQLCKTAGVPIGSNILINLQRETSNDKRIELIPYNFSEIKGKPLIFTLAGHEAIELVITGQLTGLDVPNEIGIVYDDEFMVVVPECESTSYIWFAKVSDVAGFMEYATQVMHEMAPQSEDWLETYSSAFDIAGATKQMRDLSNTIMFFVYGFVGMLMLIAVTSVISTVSTNVRARAREFAVLESVGMTKQGLRKMLNLESILCSARSLAFGLPIGIGGAYALYQGMGLSVELPFVFPWVLVAECVLGVFAVTWITMRYAAGRLKAGSIIDTIRGE